jgi:hypothetical protein
MNALLETNTEVVAGTAIGPALGSASQSGLGGGVRPTITIARCWAPAPPANARTYTGVPVGGVPVRTKRSRAAPSVQHRILSAQLRSAHTAPQPEHTSWR